jgi:nucleoside-diphosphate-sugar epimerase
MAVRVAVRRSDMRFADGVEVTQVGGIDGDTDWRDALRGVTTLVHCAARAHVTHERATDPAAEFARVNVEGTANLARQAASAGVRRMVYISSIGVNGSRTFVTPFSAEDKAAPASAYAMSKYHAELALQSISYGTGLEFVVIRPPLIHGPGAKGNFDLLIKWINSGWPLPLGAVRNKRSFVGIDNLIDLIFICLNHPCARNQIFLISDGEDISTTEFIRRIARILGRSPRLVAIPPALLRLGANLAGRNDLAQRLIGSLQIDDSKTRESLRWSPPMSLNEGLQRLAGR